MGKRPKARRERVYYVQRQSWWRRTRLRVRDFGQQLVVIGVLAFLLYIILVGIVPAISHG